ncbi:MAG: 2-C-methyl-D-erythritol 4-phosphate cytidylyltransferase [Brockia lithotrophica]|nr:2-C-methyl-D-erythritol 4-phosphate cytidylyltransferase [Brockia lithotrophica]MBT9253524.1 2-C-methyl-D-erythritol 4-phosphate cytidylyltransferase [Brockia lithotrophica]
MGGTVRKPFLPLAGVPVLVHTARVFARVSDIEERVIVVHREDLTRADSLLASYGIRGFRLVAGGERRQDSVFLGVRALSDEVHGVLVHDGVRPLVSEALVRKMAVYARGGRVVVPALPVKDTIKEISGRQVLRTPKRESLIRVQTPQAFPRLELLRALEEAERRGWEVTDEASVFERLGFPVFWTEGEEYNLKLTTPEDLAMAEALLRILSVTGSSTGSSSRHEETGVPPALEGSDAEP